MSQFRKCNRYGIICSCSSVCRLIDAWIIFWSSHRQSVGLAGTQADVPCSFTRHSYSAVCFQYRSYMMMMNFKVSQDVHVATFNQSVMFWSKFQFHRPWERINVSLSHQFPSVWLFQECFLSVTEQKTTTFTRMLHYYQIQMQGIRLQFLLLRCDQTLFLVIIQKIQAMLSHNWHLRIPWPSCTSISYLSTSHLLAMRKSALPNLGLGAMHINFVS